LVMLEAGELRVYNSETGLSLATAAQNEPDIDPESFISTRPNMARYLAQVSGEEVRGVLAVHRQEPLSPAEGSLVQALASQVYVREENQRLFQETMAQRSHLA